MAQKNDSLLKELQTRGLIAQTTADKELAEHLLNSRVIYCGFDPTADSLHLGHLVPLLVLKRFQKHGHTPIALVGGATGLIGDPSFKANERKLNTTDIVSKWVEKIKKQVSQFIDFTNEKNTALIVNNYDWTKSINILDFLRRIGKYFSVNNMINKESVKQRINKSDSGISFTEFSYALLQGLDFSELNKKYNCTIQIGGSDQWGNIVGGIDLTRRLNKAKVFGLTVPLITKSDGTKFGKSEGEAIWLSANKTSPYKFYQFWLNTSDTDVYNFLNFFTFLTTKEIHLITRNDMESNQKPQAQKILADNVTKLVHGSNGLQSAKRITQALFSGEISNLSELDLNQLRLDGLPHAPITELDLNKSMSQLLVEKKVVRSGKQVKDALSRKAILINAKPISTEDNVNLHIIFTKKNALFQKFFILKMGKKNYFLFKLI